MADNINYRTSNVGIEYSLEILNITSDASKGQFTDNSAAAFMGSLKTNLISLLGSSKGVLDTIKMAGIQNKNNEKNATLTRLEVVLQHEAYDDSFKLVPLYDAEKVTDSGTVKTFSVIINTLGEFDKLYGSTATAKLYIKEKVDNPTETMAETIV